MLGHLLGRGEAATEAVVTARGDRLNYADLLTAVEKGVKALKGQGVAPGRVVAVRVADPASALVAMLAVLDTGAALLPLDTRVGEAALGAIIARARPVAVVEGATLAGKLSLANVSNLASPGSPAAVGNLTHPSPAPHGAGGSQDAASRLIDPRVALLLFTSGSSGEPKGVLLSREALIANIDAILGYLPVVSHPRTAIVLPLSYSYALVGQALVTLRAGGTAIMLADLGFPTAQVEAMVRLRATGLSSVPPSLRWIAQAAQELDAGDRPPLGYLASAGAPLDEKTLKLVRETWPAATLFNQYGLTEACPRVAALSSHEPPFATGSVGRALPGLKLTVTGPDDEPLPPDQPGDLVVAGPSVMLGYMDDPVATAAAFGPHGLKTGDAARMDADGYVWVLGRTDGVVKCGGERVSLEEVAAVVRRTPGIGEAVVVAVPDELLGARLVAYVEAPDDAVIALVRATTRENLPAAKRPHQIRRLPSLPRGAHGKIDLAALRREATHPA